MFLGVVAARPPRRPRRVGPGRPAPAPLGLPHHPPRSPAPHHNLLQRQQQGLLDRQQHVLLCGHVHRRRRRHQGRHASSGLGRRKGGRTRPPPPPPPPTGRPTRVGGGQPLCHCWPPLPPQPHQRKSFRTRYDTITHYFICVNLKEYAKHQSLIITVF